MRTKQNAFRFFTVTFPLFLVYLLMTSMMTGCSEDTETIIEHDTTYVHINITPIELDDVHANPNTTSVGGTVKLMAKATPGSNVNLGPLTYRWYAQSGTFVKAEGDTVKWKAPDEPTVVTISVHATDGVYIGIGHINVGVGMYAPTVTPYYMGDQACAQCHSGVHPQWKQTAHAKAWDTMMNSGSAASYCYKCHSVGYEGPAGNSGYDEAPILKFTNVQCENCHGPGSSHASNPPEYNMQVTFSAENCGKCHQGAHAPYFDEWKESPHAWSTEAGSAWMTEFGGSNRASCWGCHEGVAAGYRLSGDLNKFYGSGAVANRPPTTEMPLSNISCATCHNSHDATNPGQLRTVNNVYLVTANGESPVVTDGGVGKLCMQCHHARRGPDSQVTQGYANFGPHANPQADMMAGKSAYHPVAPAGFPWAGPSHLRVQNSCKTCHLNRIEFSSTTGTAVTGHTFLPKVEACANCHGAISSFDDIKALYDFDGDRKVEGVQSEVQGLMDVLKMALLASGLDTTGTTFVRALGDTTRAKIKQRAAGFNWVYVENDKSLGVHNPDYAVQLLQQSYRHLTGQDVPAAAIARGDNMVADVRRDMAKD